MGKIGLKNEDEPVVEAHQKKTPLASIQPSQQDTQQVSSYTALGPRHLLFSQQLPVYSVTCPQATGAIGTSSWSIPPRGEGVSAEISFRFRTPSPDLFFKCEEKQPSASNTSTADTELYSLCWWNVTWLEFSFTRQKWLCREFISTNFKENMRVCRC